MTLPIEDYGLIGDTQTAALVGRDGSIDWLCLPRFDSGSCFTRLLGDESHGRWLIEPTGQVSARSRQYRGNTTILETTLTTASGVVRVLDFMPPRQHHPRVIRVVQGVSGRVELRTELVVRFEYGMDIPWVQRRSDGRLLMIAGPEALVVDTDIHLRGEHLRTEGTFSVAAGDEVAMSLSWFRSHLEPPEPPEPAGALAETERFWEEWGRNVREVHGEWEDLVRRSLVTLKALTFEPTGGIVAAPTTSLPEQIGGVRNWDYRYCWVRDASFTLDALVDAGCRDEATSWMQWLVRAVAGSPEQLQIMYGPAGERRLTEFEVGWLPGYAGSAPVRVGNAAAEQFQLDVYGELMDAFERARRHGIETYGVVWDVQLALMDFLVTHWREPDEGLWEIRGPRRHFTHSKVMAWVAFDRAVRAVEEHGLKGPVDVWRQARQAVFDEVLTQGFDAERETFTQYYGSKELDAALLMIPLVGFLPADDKRVVGTVEAVKRELLHDGFVRRYDNGSGVDGLPGTEGAFLPCTFWLVGCLTAMGRLDEAREVFGRLVGLANDLGLLAEEYDPVGQRMVGNFPQAFTHVALVNAARDLTAAIEGVNRGA